MKGWSGLGWAQQISKAGSWLRLPGNNPLLFLPTHLLLLGRGNKKEKSVLVGNMKVVPQQKKKLLVVEVIAERHCKEQNRPCALRAMPTDILEMLGAHIICLESESLCLTKSLTSPVALSFSILPHIAFTV
ncbi:hypothetical protein V6N13_071727 [Hibiscus sabdariffa]|uniref:Uncharacterized protein n=1 Tax=Hibiscus sabdariffa TaxID=183260 RepID=A0ABR2TCJ9_9ROSI